MLFRSSHTEVEVYSSTLKTMGSAFISYCDKAEKRQEVERGKKSGKEIYPHNWPLRKKERMIKLYEICDSSLK